MRSTLSATVRLWLASRERGECESFWGYLKIHNPWVFSHHPAHNCFRDHVWAFRGLYFCKGCVVSCLGWTVAILTQLGTGWLQALPVKTISCVFVALLAPVVLTSLLDVSRVWKHLSRFLLGFLMVSSAWYLFLADQWWAKVMVVLVYFGVKTPLDRLRARKNQRWLMSSNMVAPKNGGLCKSNIPHVH